MHLQLKRSAVAGLLYALMSIAAAAVGPVPQSDANPVEVSLDVHGVDGKTRHFSAAELAQLKQYAVEAKAHGQNFKCVGERLIDVVATVGAVQGEALRGKQLASYVRVTAADGYRAVFSLAELDPAMRDAVAILTSRCKDKPLDAKDGPLRIIVRAENRPARWVRQLITIEVMSAVA